MPISSCPRHWLACFGSAGLCVLLVVGWALPSVAADPPVDFNRDIRSILSNNCLTCHGPDADKRQAGLRLDRRDGALAELESGSRAIVPGQPDDSELVRRIRSDDDSERMPPPEFRQKLSPREIELLTTWLQQGAPYAEHWSYARPTRPPLPNISRTLEEVEWPPSGDRATIAAWPQNPIDEFVLERMLRQGFVPSPEADRYALIRRVTLDLTGLPPTLAEVDRFVHDPDPAAYEQLVDRLLDSKAYGEHWARLWLDLARYADSAGYADDPPRTIWAYRDWVIRAINDNRSFADFTVDQLAGDLLPQASDDQRMATAFHRNTLTNNEGGTNDEEFRSVAIVDRVNTTMAVWMGTTMACAQCHNHKYDPISQEDYFRFYAILNNTEDADRQDESPVLQLLSAEQQQQQSAWQAESAALEETLQTPTDSLRTAQAVWEQSIATDVTWHGVQPATVTSREHAPLSIHDDGSVLIGEARAADVFTLELPVPNGNLTALRLESLPHPSLPNGGSGFGGGNFVVTGVHATLTPPDTERPAGRFLRIELPGDGKILSLAEVQIFQGNTNLAPQGAASQSSTAYDGPANLAIDGNTDGRYESRSTTHTATEANPWWELDLKSSLTIDRLVIWNRTDEGVQGRLAGCRVALLNERRETVWEQTVGGAPQPSRELAVNGIKSIRWRAAHADHAQSGFDPIKVLEVGNTSGGWAIGGQTDRPHRLTLIADAPPVVPAGSRLTLTIEQLSPHANHILGHFRVALSDDLRAVMLARTPPAVVGLARVAPEQRTEAQQTELTRYFLSEVAEELTPQRTRLAELKKQIAELKPATSVPICRELPADRRRTTHVQRRGNFLDLGREVTPGVPAAIYPLPEGQPVDRLALARWLVAADNPLTARVIANRYWESIFGRGIVLTSEEFGSQGELPTHPELLDWLAMELVECHWDTKALVKRLVSSATYRQSSRVTPELAERDSENVWLARGPRVRLSAEVIRDQALFVSGLLSSKMYGPPVKPPQPSSGLSAAFGSGIDWQTSEGADRYRRGIYTTWRRSNPYPSMTTFDAPNREVCTIRRARTNTPLQALVTLNDPVYVEAAQALARRMVAGGGTLAEQAARGFQLCLARPPSDDEQKQLVSLYAEARERLAADVDAARRLATEPLGPLPEGMEVVELAAWTTVANVVLNLDETLMKR